MVLYKIRPLTKFEEVEVDSNNPLGAVKNHYSNKIKFKVQNIETGDSWIVGLFEVKVCYEEN